MLPEQIIQLINNSKLTAIQQERAKDICNFIQHKSPNPFQKIEIGSKLVRKIVKTRSYEKPIMDFLRKEILENDHCWVVGSKCIYYRFKPNFFINPQFNLPVQTNFDLKQIWSMNELESYTYNNIKKITYNQQDVNNFINNFTFDMSNIKVNTSITDTYVYVQYSKQSYRMKLSTALSKASDENKDLIMYKDKCYIERTDIWVRLKTLEIKYKMIETIQKLDNSSNHIPSRNETNHRLDSILTNTKKDLLPFLKFEDENLKELDMVNAQWAIMANKFKDEVDPLFYDLATSGKLYEYIATNFNVDRKEAKNMCFKLCFGKVMKNEDNPLESLFPETIKTINTYKKLHGYKQFSILLQNEESTLMIDGLLKHLKDLKYNLFSIHDAIRVKESQYLEVRDVVNKYFIKNNFVCTLNLK